MGLDILRIGLSFATVAAHFISLPRCQVENGMQRTKPNLLQCFFADNGPTWLFTVLSITICLSLLVRQIIAGAEITFISILLDLLLVLIVSALGFMLTFLPGYLILYPMYQIAGKMNGAPFRVGDTVMVLSKKHRGKIGTVTSASDFYYGVKIGAGLESEVSDSYFPYVELCRFRETKRPLPDGRGSEIV